MSVIRFLIGLYMISAAVFLFRALPGASRSEVSLAGYELGYAYSEHALRLEHKQGRRTSQSADVTLYTIYTLSFSLLLLVVYKSETR